MLFRWGGIRGQQVRWPAGGDATSAGDATGAAYAAMGDEMSAADTTAADMAAAGDLAAAAWHRRGKNINLQSHIIELQRWRGMPRGQRMQRRGMRCRQQT